MTNIVTLTRTGRQYRIGTWDEVGTEQENIERRDSYKSYFSGHYGDQYTMGNVIRNGKPFGGIRMLFRSEVTE